RLAPGGITGGCRSSMDMQTDAEQRKPPQQNGQNGRAYGLEQAEVQVAAGPCNDHADDQVNEKDNADRPFQHGCSAPVHWWIESETHPPTPPATGRQTLRSVSHGRQG